MAKLKGRSWGGESDAGMSSMRQEVGAAVNAPPKHLVGIYQLHVHETRCDEMRYKVGHQ